MPPSIHPAATPQVEKGMKISPNEVKSFTPSGSNKSRISRKTKNVLVDKKSTRVGTGNSSNTTTLAKANSDKSHEVNEIAITSQPSNDCNMGLGMGGGLGMGMGGGLGMGMGMGMGMYSGMGYSPYGIGGGMMMGGGALSGLNQFLFGFQNLIFSLGQAMQILGMNTQALQQLFHTGMSMFDNAIQTLNEMNAICDAKGKDLTEEEIKRRRRLKALRWTIVLGVSFTGYKIIRKWFRQRRIYREFKNKIESSSTQPSGHFYSPDNRYQQTLRNYSQPHFSGSSLRPYNRQIPSYDHYSNHTHHMDSNYSPFGPENTPYGSQGMHFI